MNMMKKILIMTLICSGCSTIEVLPGLCYSDAKQTHLCEQPAPLDPETEECIQKGDCKYV